MSYKVIPSNQEQEEYIKIVKPNRKINKAGMIFGNLKVLRKNKDNKLYYDCLCLNCGNECIIENRKLTLSGKGVSSCGCLSKFNGWKEKDENYFSKIDTPNKAYFLGFIAADGSVYISSTRSFYSLTIRIKSIDIDILEKFKLELKSNIDITTDEETVKLPKNYGYKKIEESKIAIASKKMVEDLGQYGIIPNKTKKLKINWEKIPSEYLRDFIRGFLDGDGCYSYSKTKSNRIRPSITVGSCPYLINDLKKILNTNNFNHWHIDEETEDFYVLRNGSKYEIIKVFDYLYKDSEIYLDRKYNKMCEIRNLIEKDIKNKKRIQP